MRPRNHYEYDGWYSWLVCAGATISNGVVNAPLFSFGVFLPVLMNEFNQNREKTALIGSLIFATCSFFCLVAAKICHRYGCQRTHILGTLTCAVSLLITSWATGITFMYFSLSVLYGIGISLAFVPCFLVINDYFKKRHSLAVGMVTAGTAAGFFVFGPFSQALIDSIGWRNCYRVHSGLLLGCCCISFLFKSNVDKKEIQDHRRHWISQDSQTKSKKLMTLNCSIWRIPGFTIPVLSFIIVFFSHFSPAIHVVRHFEEMGITSKRSSYLFIGLGLGSLFTRIAAGKICEYIPPIRVSQVAILCSGVSTLLLSMKHSYVVLVVLTLIYGLADGAFLTTFNVILLMSVEEDKRAFAYGIGNMAITVSVALGPMVTGLVADHYSYYEAFLVTGCVTLAGLLVSLSLICFKNQEKANHLPLKDLERLEVYEKVTVV